MSVWDTPRTAAVMAEAPLANCQESACEALDMMMDHAMQLERELIAAQGCRECNERETV